MTPEIEAEMDGALRRTAAGHKRLLSALRLWRAALPDTLLRTALLQSPQDEELSTLQIDTDRIAHSQMLPHLHFSVSERMKGHPLEQQIRTARLFNGLRCKKLNLERNELIALFQQGEIDMLVFKGADLAYSTYPDPCCRVVGDIDLLVDDANYERAVKLLSAAGWMPSAPASIPARKHIKHSTSWSHPKIDVSIDVQNHASHHAIWPGTDQIYFDRAVTRRDPSGIEYRALCPEHGLVQVCAHGAAQNFYPPVRWAADAVWILRQAGAGFDWELMLEAVHNNRSGPILAVTLEYLRLVLGVNIPTDVLGDVRSLGARRSYRTAWSYRLELPRSAIERGTKFMAEFREGCTESNLLLASKHFPNYLRDSQKKPDTISAIKNLAYKAILNRHD